MAENLKICEIDPDLKKKLKDFRFRKEKNNAALIMKISKEARLIECEEELADCQPEDVRDALPERNPRFFCYSFRREHADGRVSYPLCFVFSSPLDCKPELNMLYAGSKTALINELHLTKTFELREVHDFTQEWLLEQLSRY
ncbi:glia maturation factor gamma-like [Paramacrobiotus metropolitanus]|uniref:glia maturation factor gamma-like n=1 Tax=Paramacrobiotus metropolitanus TaxID=2943436 RepID=UPI002445AF3C|nr:glia maturation factor gamma-like [Paramacrobiotus metropolitanus]